MTTKKTNTPGALDIARDMDKVHDALTRALACEDGGHQEEIQAALDYIYGFVGSLKNHAAEWDAAPDLLEAAKALDEEGITPDRMDALHAAIAKAEGH